MKPSSATPPFALFFPLAALDAIAVGCAWLVALQARSETLAKIAEWHRSELLFGFVAAALAGFLLTALPRWTGLPLAKGAVPAVCSCWIAARLAPAQPSPYALLVSAPAAMVTIIAAVQVWRARDRRNVKTILLLATYSAAGAASLGPFASPLRALSTNVAIAALIGLIVLIAGRVLPALTARFDQVCGAPARDRRGKAFDIVFSTLTAAALFCWLFASEGPLAALLMLAAGVGEASRMAAWLGRRSFDSPPLLALYAAYAAIPLGFGFMAAHALAPDAAPASAGLHVSAVGGFGGMILTIMASMIRKRRHRAFRPSLGAEASAALCLVAAAARAWAAFAIEPQPFLGAASAAWVAAFVLFLLAFRGPLVEAVFRKSSAEPPHDRQTGIHW